MHCELTRLLYFNSKPPGEEIWPILYQVRLAGLANKCVRVTLLLLFSCSVMSDSLWPHGLQHARLLCPSHYLPEFAQTHVYWASVAIQSSHPLLPTSPPALNLSQHWGYVYKYKIIHCLFEIQIQLRVLHSTRQYYVKYSLLVKSALCRLGGRPSGT